MKTLKTMVFLVLAATVLSGCGAARHGELDYSPGCGRRPDIQASPSGK